MDTKKQMLPNRTVRKSNALARARWSADSVWEPRLVAILASQIKAGDTDFQIYEIRFADILGKEPGGNDYKILKETAYKAMSRVIVINDSKGWSMYNLFSKCRFDSQKGILEVCFHPDLKAHFLQLKQYMKYNLLEFMLLPSVYSQRIFEFLKSWDDRKEVTIELAELHEMLDTPKSFRDDFFNFKARVLEKAHKDILEFTDLNYSWEPVKKGRAVHSIRFVILEKSKKASGTAKPLEAETQNSPIHNQFEAFLQKFPNSSRSRLKAWKVWNELHENGKAPMAEDVPANCELRVTEFLKKWQA